MDEPWALAVHPDHYGDAWPLVAGMLAPAVAHAEDHTMGDIRERLDRREAHLWIGGRDQEAMAAAICQMVEKPLKKRYQIWLCGGEDLQVCRALEGAISKFAKAEGCDEVLIAGRDGWLRVLDGYEKRLTVMRKKL